MSRKIETKASITISEEELYARNTAAGKLLFTVFQGRHGAFVIEEDRLVEVSFSSKQPGKIGAVYIGKVKNIAKNMDACFVEIAKGEICFLPLKNATSPFLVNRRFDGRILEGDELLVQVVRDAQKTKRASVTANISLANEYFAINFGCGKVGYSAKLSPKKKASIRRHFTETAIFQNDFLIQDVNTLLSISEARKMKSEGMNPETIPLPEIGLIVRTKAEELEPAEYWDAFFTLSGLFVRLLYTAMHRSCFSCLREAPAEFEAVLQSFSRKKSFTEVTKQFPFFLPEPSDKPVSLTEPENSKQLCTETPKPSLGNREIVTDQKELYEQLQEYCTVHHYDLSVRFYQDSSISLSALYALESKMQAALERRIWLKSGGSLIIDYTEALTVIDVNSGKYEAGKNSREAYQKINMEAAGEVARQLRLRNLSGIIIVDFINMQSAEDNRHLLHYMRELAARDSVPTKVIDMTALGLVEITRQKINKPLREQFQKEQKDLLQQKLF